LASPVDEGKGGDPRRKRKRGDLRGGDFWVNCGSPRTGGEGDLRSLGREKPSTQKENKSSPHYDSLLLLEEASLHEVMG